tara:strand:+ start:11261 stop:12109 length:849 start_codon:yes stop_codon:yes gene_type:complete
MKKIGLIVDSTFGLNEELTKKEDVLVIPLTVYMDDVPHDDGTITTEQLVEAFNSKVDFKTSQPTPEAFLKAMDKHLESYEEVMVLCLTKALSGTYNSAMLAKDMCKKPDKVTVFDTESTSGGGLYFLEHSARMRSEGKGVKEIVKHLEELKNLGTYYVTVDNLKYLVKGGRISPAKAVIGNLLKKKPVLKFKDGLLGLDKSVRSFVGVKNYIYEKSSELSNEGELELTVYISYVDDIERAHSVKSKLEELGPKIHAKIVGQVSPVISAHVGLGALGIYIAKH